MTCEARGRSLELFFVNGIPDGMQTAKVSNWNIHVLLAPRTSIHAALDRNEAKYTGAYLLLGEGDNGEPWLYIGEGENMADRIRNHIAQRDWWTTAVFITRSDSDLNKAHVRYLEQSLYKVAESVGLAVIKNGNEPGGASLSEADEHTMEAFLNTLMMVLPAMRIDCFLEKNREEVNTERASNENLPVFELQSDKLNVDATAVLENGEMVVQKGSVARKKWESSVHSGYAQLTEDLHKSGVLRREDGCSVFTCNYAFASPSAAAAVVRGTPATGYEQWKLKKTGETYGQWERRRLEEDA
ncbi:MAG: GIY-YIG nuclease family protein [Rhodospirillales bacterium]